MAQLARRERNKDSAATASLAARPGIADERRASLVRAAYDIIAAEGFERLRTRDVADRVGINVGTLHYYFPTKEALIEAVAKANPRTPPSSDARHVSSAVRVGFALREYS